PDRPASSRVGRNRLRRFSCSIGKSARWNRAVAGIFCKVAENSRGRNQMRIRWRGFELPSTVTCEKESLTPTYGKFVAEPFERGFGVTVGNAIRRVLLSSLEGSSITQVKIQGAQHEFTTIPGVVEDVTDVILNIKS